jgi:alpha-tubulin suppressor-like RCC1 family protein
MNRCGHLFGPCLALLLSTLSATATEVATVSVTAPFGTNATLVGSVRPQGHDTVAWFEWGPSVAYGSNTPPVEAGQGNEAVAIEAGLAGLLPGRLYRFRAVATNSLGRFQGPDRFFISPLLSLKGANPATNFVDRPYVDPGLSATAPPVALGAGFSHSLYVKADGTVAGAGLNTYGQATNFPGLTNIVMVSGGFLHSLALRNDGSVVAWGLGLQGQTNVASGLTNAVAVSAGEYHSMALRADGTVLAWGSTNYQQTAVPPDLTNAVGVAAGQYHCLALRSDGTVVGWGANDAGQTRIPVELTNAVAISSGRNHGLALTAAGTVKAWGLGGSGQTNVPPGLSNVVALAAGFYHNLALCSDGSIVAWGLNNDGQTNVPVSLSNVVVVAVAAGGYHSLARTLDGTIIGWGRNDFGQRVAPAGLNNVGAGVVTISGEVDTNTVGRYELAYQAANYLGGGGTTSRTVEVVPYTPPLLTISPGPAGTATVAWSPPTSGFVLQHSSNLFVTNWTAAISGSTNPATVGLTNGVRFYRLRQP